MNILQSFLLIDSTMFCSLNGESNTLLSSYLCYLSYPKQTQPVFKQ